MSITVTTKEGVFAYAGTDSEGRAKWPFFSKDNQGQLVGRPTPRRFKRILKSQLNEEAADAHTPRFTRQSR